MPVDCTSIPLVINIIPEIDQENQAENKDTCTWEVDENQSINMKG